MSISLTPLNGDSSWIVEMDGTKILLDPWLEGPAVVGIKPLHVARLGLTPVPIEELPDVEGLVVSHPYPDHCQAQTLRKLHKDLPAWAHPIVRLFVQMHGRFKAGGTLGDCSRGAEPTVIGNLEAAYCKAPTHTDPTHNVMVFRGRQSGHTILYCPHGMFLKGCTLEAVERLVGGRPDVLMCSFTLLDLPFYLGGVANLGKEAAFALVEHFSPRSVLQTHDGDKPDSGLIARVEKLVRCEDVPGELSGREFSGQVGAPEIGVPWSPDLDEPPARQG